MMISFFIFPTVVCPGSSVNDHYHSESVHSEDDNETTTTLSKLHSDSVNAPPSTDPATWINLSNWEKLPSPISFLVFVIT